MAQTGETACKVQHGRAARALRVARSARPPAPAPCPAPAPATHPARPRAQHQLDAHAGRHRRVAAALPLAAAATAIPAAAAAANVGPPASSLAPLPRPRCRRAPALGCARVSVRRLQRVDGEHGPARLVLLGATRVKRHAVAALERSLPGAKQGHRHAHACLATWPCAWGACSGRKLHRLPPPAPSFSPAKPAARAWGRAAPAPARCPGRRPGGAASGPPPLHSNTTQFTCHVDAQLATLPPLPTCKFPLARSKKTDSVCTRVADGHSPPERAATLAAQASRNKLRLAFLPWLTVRESKMAAKCLLPLRAHVSVGVGEWEWGVGAAPPRPPTSSWCLTPARKPGVRPRAPPSWPRANTCGRARVAAGGKEGDAEGARERLGACVGLSWLSSQAAARA